MKPFLLLLAILCATAEAESFIEPKVAFLERLSGNSQPDESVVTIKIRNRLYSVPGSCFSPRALASNRAGHNVGSQLASRNLSQGQKGREHGGLSGGREIGSGTEDRLSGSGSSGRLAGSGTSGRLTGGNTEGINTGSQAVGRNLGAGDAASNRGSNSQSRVLGSGASVRTYSAAVMTRLAEAYGLDRLLGSDEMSYFVDGKMVNRIFGSDIKQSELICIPSMDGLGFHIAGIQIREDYQLYINGLAKDADLDENRHLYVEADYSLYFSG